MMTCQQTPESRMANIAQDAIEMVRILSRWNGNESLICTLSKASGEDLFFWWHEATAHAQAAPLDRPWDKNMGEALASEIAKECVRRLKPA